MMTMTASPLDRPMRFAAVSDVVFLTLPRGDALDLLAWLGLGRPEFGAIEAKVLVPLCRRRLWPEMDRFDRSGRMRQMVSQLLRAIASSRSAIVHFG